MYKRQDLIPYTFPEIRELEKLNYMPVSLGSFIPWDHHKNTEVILDRKEAIYKGVESLKDNEVLLILGKGHEKDQEIQNKFYPFDDVKIAREALELRN